MRTDYVKKLRSDPVHFPSLKVNCNGDMVMGFSGSSSNNYIGAYYSWLFCGSSASTAPFTIRPGTIYYGFGDRWGDYSYTSVDPADDWSFWTTQEYADQSQDLPGSQPVGDLDYAIEA